MLNLPDNIISNWQEITDLVGEYCNVPACLVMRGNPETMEVMVCANLPDNPYQAGETAPRNNELYCETVIKNQKPLEVVDANTMPEWQGNPDTKLGLFSYYGVPVNWPNGDSFGTFCILDSKPKKPSSMEKRFIACFANVIEDHLRLIDLNEKYKFEANHDALTGIYNRRMFIDTAKRQISSSFRTKSPLALVAFDLDHFKSINDELGHAVGDKVLKAVSKAVNSNLREADIFARTGGEEFVVLGNIENINDVMSLAERVRTAVESSNEVLRAAGRKITISCGATDLRKSDDLSTLLKRADEALYDAKSAGRNCSRVY